MSFELTPETVVPWLVGHGLARSGVPLTVTELRGGVSASVLAVRGSGVALVVKQALPRLRVADEWLASQTRTETEAAAMTLCGALTPGAVPAVLASDPARHLVAMELIEGAENWQAAVAGGAVQPELGAWAGTVLATWHRETAGQHGLEHDFGDLESFEEQRVRPFHEAVMRNRPELADAIAPYRDALRTERTCLVHGDFAMKNMLVGESGRFVLDFEVAHMGNPLFDLGFFLSFVVLSAVHWPDREVELRSLADGFLAAYRRGSAFARDDKAVAGHTACLILARTDGTSPALFLDDGSRDRARETGTAMLGRPDRGLWVRR